MGLGLPPLHPATGHAYFRRIMKQQALRNPDAMLAVIDLAHAGWDEADLALRELIMEFTNRGEALPAFLVTYTAEVLTGRVAAWPRGPKPTAHIIQDPAICLLVSELIERFHLKPRRTSKRRPSACSVAAQALAEAGLHRGGEKAIEAVWHKYRRLFPLRGEVV